MVGGTEPRLLYWRIVLVGWGTVVGTGLFMAVVTAIWSKEPKLLAIMGFYSISLGAIISVILAIPMLVIWVPIFATIRRSELSVRRAATLTTGMVAVIGMAVFALVLGLAIGRIGEAMRLLLPWTPVAIAISGCLAWYAFDETKDLGTQ